MKPNDFKYYLKLEKTIVSNGFPRFFAMMALVLLGICNMAQGQNDYSGVYYIANKIWNGSNTSSPYYLYSYSTPEYNWYLVPAADPHLDHYSDAYFNDQYCNTNSSAVDYTGDHYGDPEKPFLTTYRTNRDNNSIWIIKKTTDQQNVYYYIIHALTGKYVKYQPPYKSFSSRKTMHLEDVATDSPGNEFQFSISTLTEGGIEGFNIAPRNKGGNYFNPAGDNWPRYYGTNDGSKTPYSSGMIGLWTASGGGSLWPRENDARAALTPTLGDLNQANNKVTITCDFVPPSCQIVYTTDGNDPTVSTITTCSNGHEIEIRGTMTIKAAIVGYGMVLSNIAEREFTEFVLEQPQLTTTCDNKLEITCSNLPEGGTIRYTITTGDGSQADPEDPTSGSTLYEGILTDVAVGTKVKAKAFYGSLKSEASGVHAHAFTHTAAPVITTSSSTQVTITGPGGSTIYYTTNGVDPVIGASGVTSHATPVTVDFGGNMTEFRAIAKTSTLETSCVTRYVTMGPPTITIVTDDCSETSPRGNVIDIPIPSDGSTIWYAVTAGNNSAAPGIGDTPNPYSQYTGPVVLDGYDGSNTHYTIHAYARSGDGQNTSGVTFVSHAMKTGGKPELTPPVGSNPVILISGGVFGDKAVCSATGVADQEVSIASDGTAEYEILPEATGTLTVSFKHGSWQNSCATTFALPSAPATPTKSQDCADKLSIVCESLMADIHYTTDNSEPTLESRTYTPGCLDKLTSGTIVRAKAFDGFRSSGELSFTYEKLHSTPPQFFVEGTTVTISGDPGAAVYYNFSTNGDLTIPAEPADATTGSTPYSGNYTLTGITIFNAIAVSAGKQPSCPVRVLTREGYSINSPSDLNKLEQHTDKYFFVFNDIDASSYTTTVPTFTGVIEGNSHTISGITKPLFGTVTGAVIHDLTLDSVNIDITTASTNVGAFACNANGSTRIYNCGITDSNSSVSGTQYVGGMVGFLDGTNPTDAPRVINCFSYANINGGTHRGGIVGYNNYASTSSNLRNMVMNCMFYGVISIDGSPAAVAPIYCGALIHNKREDDNNTGMNNYCYFYYNGDYLSQKSIPITYNGALGAEERFLNRFEFFRQTLNSTRNMAAYYVSNDVSDKDLIAKWVLKPDVAPYPILDAPGYYPSRVNLDAEHAVPIDPDNANYNKGRKLGTLTVNIEMGDGAKFNHPGTGTDEAQIERATLTLNVTDKDPDNFNFNYKKVQLPYYNQVGTKNYTDNRVVTGWKIVEVNGSTTGSGTFVNTGADYPAFNFADRACSNKDLYSVSGRVWNQGAYWEVPDGVTEITIQPYWAKAAYLSDAYYDMTYRDATKYGVTVAGQCPTTFNGGQTVYNTVSDAISALGIEADTKVYDYAVVLVGNYHQYAELSIYGNTENKPATFMSADMDGDCEPDNTLFYYHNKRQRVAPIRFDFLNMPGIGMVKRTHDSGKKPEPGIFKPTSWFEVTNTVNLYCGQFEYCDGNSSEDMPKIFEGPLILQGGIYQQFVSSFKGDAPDLTPYIHVGGNAWFMNFANGCHTNTYRKTHNMPITVTGGDYENFYLTGIYRPDGTPDPEDAECYIDGGRFGEVAGAGMQLIDGNVTWMVNAADIDKFFGGGINAAKSITGNITTTIKNSRVTEFYGGPKFGDMKTGKDVTTTATNCTFGLFFGAGYGGTAFNKYGHEDATITKTNNTAPWNSYVNNHYLRNYSSDSKHQGISTSYAYEYILFSDGEQTVARFFVNYASLSLASTQDVVSTLDGCEIGRFYGGGRLGAVYGNVSSTLTDCTVIGDAFGSGFSAEVPTVMVMSKENFVVAPEYNRTAGVFNNAQVVFPAVTQYEWSNSGSNTSPFIDDGETHLIHTDVSLNGLGAVYGNATLTIQGNSVVKGDVYGGGAKSSSNTNGGTCTVNILGGTYGVDDGGTVTGGNIYGGGMGDLASLVTTEDPEHKDVAVTEDEVEVNIGSSEQDANSVVIYGSVYGCNNINGTPQGDATVHVWKTKHNSNNVVTNLTGGHALKEVFGGGNKASYLPTEANKKATVHVHNCDNTIQYVYGGGNAADVGASGEAPAIESATDVIIDGGRILWLFGGGNGYSATDNHSNPGEPNYNPGANVYGNTNVTYHAGDITYLFGGSNEYGVVSGSKNMSLANDASCSISNHIAELYGGNNKADIDGNVEWAMACTSTPCQIDYLFGGSRMANISGDVTLTVNGGLYDYVFGGNNLGGIIDGNVTLNLYGGTINQAAFGGNKGGPGQQEYDYFKIIGDITVNVEDHCPDCPLQVNNVFGAGDQASYIAPTGEGAREHNPMVNVKNLCSDKTITGNVYGGGNGLASDLSQMTGSVTGKPMVTIGDVTEGHEDYRAAVSGNVFGGGNAAKVTGNTTVLMQKSNSTVGGDIYGGGALANTGSTIVTLDGGTVTYDIYGGGLGDNTHAAVVDGTAQVTVNGGTVRDVFGCNNLNGAPTGAVVVDINGNVSGNVYGGGNEAAYTGTPDVNINSGVVSGSVFGGGNEAGVGGGDVTMIGGQVLTGIYGGCNTSGTVSGDIAVNINAGTVGADADNKANIHGGGYGPSTATTGDVVVNIAQTDAVEGPTIWGAVYGGSALGNVNAVGKSTTVTLNKGTINGDLYGGGLGDNDHAAAVNGAVQVTVNSGTVAGSVYGCNNINGAPQSTVNVDIYGTDAPLSGYALGQVFGGGNQAAYGGTPVVKVHNCNNSIEYVYGGGNAANVQATDVTIYGGNTIGKVFGGCYGADVTSNGTDVKIYGGTIGQVYGGNNESGSITGSILVNVNKQAEGSDPACAMKIGDVYGGGNKAGSAAGTITIGCTGTLVDLGTNEHYGVHQEGIQYVYGGANQANISSAITLNITSGIVENVFGGNNASGSISGSIQVSINKNDGAACAADWYVGNVFGAGNLAAYTGNPTVNITKGHVSNDVYGGGLGSTAVVTGAPVVTINGGSVGNAVFGGGSEAAVNGATHVIVNSGSVEQDVYGGGALANTGATTVDIMGGTITGDIYGGGLGDNTHAPAENGPVVVNIGTGTPSTDQNGENGEHFTGNATIGGSVYGCNNNAGSPQDDVTVNVYRTAHTEFDILNGTEYAIANVFGGGNKADYEPAAGKMSKVNIYGCYNTIDRVFGGGNAAATPQVETDIQGGRLHQVFGGGNGEVTAANINGNVTLRIHGGYVEQFYGASNQQGTISGSITTLVDDQGPCGSLNIVEFFCGGNFADVGHDITTTISCSDNKHVRYLYGGCNQANVAGNVQLNLYGGTYEYVFGGSKGRLAYPSTSHPEYTDINNQEAKSADITGNVTLNLYGGTITNVFGGSNVNGNISGTITVNVLDVEDPACPLYITNIYGGSNLTSYTPENPSAESPVVNVVHAKYGISGNVYGGSKGEEGFTTDVNANPRVNIGYDATSMDAYIPSEYKTDYPALLSSPRAIISGNVFGGGDAAMVVGNTAIYLRNSAKVFRNVYGGGNMGEVTGNTKVIVNGVNQ